MALAAENFGGWDITSIEMMRRSGVSIFRNI
jgi:hypothetical protein